MNIYMIYYIHDETMFGINWLHHDCSAPEETNDGEIQDTRDELMELTQISQGSSQVDGAGGSQETALSFESVISFS